MTIDNIYFGDFSTNFHFSRGFTAKPSSKTGLIVGLTIGFFVLIVCVAAVAFVAKKG